MISNLTLFQCIANKQLLGINQLQRNLSQGNFEINNQFNNQLQSIQAIQTIPQIVAAKLNSSISSLYENIDKIPINQEMPKSFNLNQPLLEIILTKQFESFELMFNNLNKIPLQNQKHIKKQTPSTDKQSKTIKITQNNNKIKYENGNIYDKNNEFKKNNQYNYELSSNQLEEKNIKYYKNKLRSFEDQNNMGSHNKPQINNDLRLIEVLKSQKQINKSSINKDFYSISKNYQKMLKLSKADPQLYQKNLSKKKKEAQEKFMSNIQFLNRIKGLNDVKAIPKQWKQQVKPSLKQTKNKNKQRIQEIGLSNMQTRKSTNVISNSLILPKIKNSPKKFQLDKPIAFNLYNVNRKAHQIYSLK